MFHAIEMKSFHDHKSTKAQVSLFDKHQVKQNICTVL